MPIDPFLKPLLASYPVVPDHIEDYDALRKQGKERADAMARQLAEWPGPDVARRERLQVEVGGGAIDILVYWPSGDGPHPVHLFLHGGGWVVGSIDHVHTDITCRERCAGAACVVVSVNYRKAPEHKFPAGLEDCYAVLMYLVDRADQLSLRTDRITVGGQSAGGNLAAALALKARDEAGPALALQLLEVPSLDLTFSLPSFTEFGTGYALARGDMEKSREAYLGSPGEMTHQYASPLLAPDLSALPPAYIMTAEFDALRDDGAEYAKRLREAGVPVTYSMQPGHVHISGQLTAVMESARSWRRESLSALRRANQ